MPHAKSIRNLNEQAVNNQSIQIIIKLAASRASQSSARIEMVIVIGNCDTIQDYLRFNSLATGTGVKGMQIIVSRVFLHPKRWHCVEVRDWGFQKYQK